MKLTKYEHACFTLEKDGKLLVVDPGAFTTDLPGLENVVGIIVTHDHPDHFDPSNLGALIARNPGAMIYAHGSVTLQLGTTLPYHAVETGDTIEILPFNMEFMGGEHAIIHDDIPVPANLAVLINESLYYPGDSFHLPNRPVDSLALPTAAPWMKMSEAFDFLTNVKPRMVFPTHDAISSDAGKMLVDRMTPVFADKVGSTYQRLLEPVEING